MRMKKPALALLALVAVGVAPSVDAQDGTAYYGISLGEFDYTDNGFGEDFFSDTVSAWHLMVGYQFMEHLAVEGAYGQSDTIRDTRTFPGLLPGQTDEVEFVSELDQILTIRLLGVLPFDNGVSLMAGIGYADIKQDIAVNVNGAPALSGEVSGNNPAYYAGAQYDWDRVALRLAYEQYDFEDADATEISLTFFYKL
jgi:opacity protein-like surface antigen